MPSLAQHVPVIFQLILPSQAGIPEAARADAGPQNRVSMAQLGTCSPQPIDARTMPAAQNGMDEESKPCR